MSRQMGAGSPGKRKSCAVLREERAREVRPRIQSKSWRSFLTKGNAFELILCEELPDQDAYVHNVKITTNNHDAWLDELKIVGWANRRISKTNGGTLSNRWPIKNTERHMTRVLFIRVVDGPGDITNEKRLHVLRELAKVRKVLCSFGHS